MSVSYVQKKESLAKVGREVRTDGAKGEHGALRVLLAGPMSGPVGGVSVHLHRLHTWLQRWGIAVELVDEGHDKKNFAYNLRTMRLIPYLICVKRCNTAHIQSSQNVFRWLHLVTCRLFGLYVVVTIHSCRSSAFVVTLNRLFLLLADRVIVVNEDIAVRLGLRAYDVIPAFLPPVHRAKELPAEVRQFVESARAHGRFLLCANASKLTVYRGEDLYGLDLCLELVDTLARQRDIDAALVFTISYPAAGNPLYVKAHELIAERGLAERFCLHNEPLDLVALMTYCDAVLRPTNTDGDALTVREALYLGIPVIASDAAQRPEGTILFRNRDVADLADRTIAVLKGETSLPAACGDADSDACVSKYVDLYRMACNPPDHSVHRRNWKRLKIRARTSGSERNARSVGFGSFISSDSPRRHLTS